MKRDFDLIRTLLHVLESSNSSHTIVPNHGLSVHDPRVQYHLRLLVDAGYVRGYCQTSDGQVCVRLTWQGHELLELSRHEVIWERAKRQVQRQTHAMSITSLHALLTRWATEMIDATDHLIPEGRASDEQRHALPSSLSSRRFIPPPTVHPPRRYRYPSEDSSHYESEPENGNGHGGNGNGNGNAKHADPQPSVQTLDPSQSSTFQFHVWSGHIETLPLYML